ncbi:pyrophosphate--fructose 6-phosphate1-phosphotransferase subunit beta [Striga asiatica]|uniref:Pyrophosphate--fructose 6-phosphate1-phosphotransferase subunit beta n=1 Tax=Striga asiatica TaxID=4170 RepID=A0A5A7PS64_STRAF|nr:pyrophosphate--fructose 6-phosphate1-phosphotransferase subunit beta [Striga asiatica]
MNTTKLNEILAHEVVDEAGVWKKKLSPQCLELFDFLPPAIQEQLMLERDPHGNVQVAKIETEKMLIQMVETELEARKQMSRLQRSIQGTVSLFWIYWIWLSFPPSLHDLISEAFTYFEFGVFLWSSVRARDKVHLLVNKMMIDNQVHVVGEGYLILKS